MQFNDSHHPFILIVDDVPKNLQILGTILSEHGYQFTPAISGKQALTIIEKRVPDLILLDIMMPGMDGYEVCKNLKSSSITKDIPIIFLTAKTDPEDIVRGFEIGGIDYITKPFNSIELLARIRTHLDIMRISNERKELIHILCHDLINIFNPIISGLKNIRNFEAFGRLKDSILTAANNGVRLIDLVRKIRALEEGKARFELESINILTAVYESAFLLKDNFEKKEIDLVTEIDKTLSVYAESVSFIHCVINNIFSNAIKFSMPASRIIVTSFQTDDCVKLSIRDFGIGMSKQLQKDIFDMKKNTTRIGTTGELGTGFGMPLVKKFMNTYGGSIEIISKEKKDNPYDHGTEIILTLKKA